MDLFPLKTPPEEELIRFPCEGCGKVLGAVPAMAAVICPKCRLTNSVPAPRAAQDLLSQPVRLVAVDVPLAPLLRLGAKLAVAALPLVGVLVVAACVVVRVAKAIWAGE